MNVKTLKVKYSSIDGITIVGTIDVPDCSSRGCVILCHGIAADKDESGKFVEASTKLCNAGFWVLRFDFRGHGESDLKSENVTIAGELLDLDASISYIADKSGHARIGLLAASFGAGPAISYAVNHRRIVQTLVLWNPVLDYEQTFLKSELPWGQSIFNASGYNELEEKGFVTIPGKDFHIGKQLIAEFSKNKPYVELMKVECPVLTIHGIHDQKVPYWVSKTYGRPNGRSNFISVESNHGFGDEKDSVIRRTVEWFDRVMS